jgi:TPR repeat protein
MRNQNLTLARFFARLDQTRAKATILGMKFANIALPLLLLIVATGRAEPIPATADTAVRCYQAMAEERFADATADCETAAQGGDTEAQFKVATLYAQGRGVTRNIDQSLHWLRQAAGAGHAEAQYNLGSAYQFGHGLPPDDTEAFRWYEQSALAGFGKAQRNLASFYEDGRGVTANVTTAFEWYLESATQGVSDSQLKVGLMYWQGEGVTRDEAKARQWIEESATSNADGQFVLGSILATEDPPLAMTWYQRAINQGHVGAMHSLAVLLFEGKGGLQDLDRAETLADSAIKGGFKQSLALKEAIVAARSQSTRPDPAGVDPESDQQPDNAPWILTASPDHFTLQLGVYSSLATIRQLIEKYDIADRAQFHATLKSDRRVYVLTCGDYRSHAEATAAAWTLRRSYPNIDLFVQRISKLQLSYQAPGSALDQRSVASQ